MLCGCQRRASCNRACCRDATARSLNPVLDSQPCYSFELALVVGDYNQPETAGMAGNHLIIRANGPALLLKLGANLSRVLCGMEVELHERQSR